MINITIYRDKNGLLKRYIVEGHSDYDEYGRDIVCSAVSILGQTALISFIEISKVDEEDLIYAIADGYLDVEVPVDLEDDIKNEIQIIVKTFEVGIKSIIENYPEHVTLEYREV